MGKLKDAVTALFSESGQNGVKGQEVKPDELDVRALETKIKQLASENAKLALAMEKSGTGEVDELTSFGYATMSKLVDERFTKRYLDSDESTFRVMAEGMLRDAFGQDVAENKKYKDLVEAVQSMWAVAFGAFGPFSAAEFDLSDLQVLGAQKQSFMRYLLDPHAGSIIDNLCSYALGRGIKVRTPSPELNEFIMDVWWNHNDLESYHKERFKRVVLAGEHFNRYKIVKLQASGDKWKGFRVNVFYIPTAEVGDIELRENRFPLSYQRTYLGDDSDKAKQVVYRDFQYAKYTEEMQLDPSAHKFDGAKGLEPVAIIGGEDDEFRPVMDEWVHHMKVGIGKRGKPFLARTLRYFQYYGDFVRDTARLWHEQARVILVEIRSSDRKGPTGKLFPSPAGGYMLIGVKNELEYQFMAPEVNGQAADALGRIIRLSISAGTRTPEIVAFYDASQSLYSSIRQSKGPYTATIQDFQDDTDEHIRKEVKWVIAQGLLVGALPEKVDVQIIDASTANEAHSVFNEAMHKAASGEDFDYAEVEDTLRKLLSETETIKVPTAEVAIEVMFPEVVEEDIRKQAEALKIHDDQGWASRFTISAKLGYDPVRELMNIIKEERFRSAELERERIRISQGKGVGKTGDREPKEPDPKKPDDDGEDE